jgi:hypothetical protein
MLIVKFFGADPGWKRFGSGMEKNLDPGWKKFGSWMEKIRIRDLGQTSRIRNTGL